MLKRIELKGFKSFADKTVIDFESGVSCIVGPNGSGKSNITDAFRWVLGEQSYKSLRGKHMTDVIFNGTVSRDALGYAEVVVVLDNGDKIVDLPYQEVSILRRLYRSGESVYSINGNTCRLKDIKDLFLDTGVGVEGYSIIVQGRIDKLLSSGKEDRRQIFEEASGIAKYKSKKEEAGRKLQRTANHLERIDDITAELELRVMPLKEQSEKAIQHLKIKNDLKSVEISLYLEEIDKVKEELANYQGTLEKYEKESEELAVELFNAKDKAGELSLAIDRVKREKQEKSNRKIELEKEKIQKEGSLKLVEERIELAEKRQEELKKTIEQADEFLLHSGDAKEGIEKELDEIRAAFSDKKTAVEKSQEEFDAKNAKLESLSAKLALIKADKRAFFDTINKIDIERTELTVLIEQAENRHLALEAEIKANEEIKQGALGELKEIQQRINALEQKEADIKAKKADVESAISESRIAIDRIENEIYQLQSEKNDALSNRDILENRIANFEGMAEPAREVLKRAKDDDRVYGTVASLISIDKEYEIALEQILGARSEYIVTEDFDSAKKYIDFLKRERLGRQSFLPLDGIRANDIIDVDDFDGLCGHAMDFIDCDDEVEPAIRYLLYNVSFVEDLDAAKRARRNAPNGYKLVTLQGDVVNVGGSVSGGTGKRRRSGAFKDKRRLEEFYAIIEEKDAALEDIRAKREEKIKHIQGYADSLQGIQKELDDVSGEKIQALAILEAERKRLSGGVESQQRILKEKEDIVLRIEDLKQRLEENKTLEASTRESDEKKTIDTDSIKAKIEALRIDINDFNLKINAENMALNKLEFELKNKEFEYKSLFEKMDKEKDGRDKLRRELEALALQIQRHHQEHQLKTDEIKKNAEESENLVREINQIDLRLKELGIKNNEDLARYRGLEQRLNELKDSMYGIRINTGKLETKLENFEQALWENYNLSYAGALEFKIDISYNKAKTLMRTYKKELDEIGDVNLLAIDEYKEVSDRYQFMLSQKNDLKESMDKLHAIIDEMDENMRRTFKESLENINEKFQKTFTDLFRGGMATIEVSDEEDILDAEIIINAQPPGKKLQTIELLSGGEKALTAIAILFAILKTKPAPFCILDEIEAALDDRNITLFSSFLTDYKKESQFIIISHRKGTIKIADALYGVTMKEKGISEVLSLKLNNGEYEAV